MNLSRIIFLILFLATFQIQAAEQGLTLGRGSFDFGQVPPGSVLEYRLLLVAGADDTLKINRIKTGCGCIVSSADSVTIAPGDSSEVVLTWDLRHQRGPLAKTVYLYDYRSDDPYKFEMTAYSSYSDSSESPLAIVRPADIRLRPTPNDSTLSANATVRNLTANICEIELVELSNTVMTLSYPETLDSGVVGQIAVSLPMEAALVQTGSSTATFDISSGGRTWRLTVPITSRLRSGTILTNNKK